MECSFPLLWRFIVTAPAAGSLPALLAAIPDPRGRQGLRHPLAAMLAAVVCGLLAGSRGCDAIADWIRNQEQKFWHLLGFKRKPPCANSYRNVLAELPPEQLETLIQQWLEPLLGEFGEQCSGELQAFSLDGKSLCGTLNPHGRSVHLLALFDQRSGGVLRQLAMPAKTNEHKAALELLKQVVLRGRVITGDAMFCQRDLCRQIIDSGGDYLITVKDNQPELKAAIAAEFEPHFSPCG
jgi:hypothetical protein